MNVCLYPSVCMSVFIRVCVCLSVSMSVFMCRMLLCWCVCVCVRSDPKGTVFDFPIKDKAGTV